MLQDSYEAVFIESTVYGKVYCVMRTPFFNKK